MPYANLTGNYSKLETNNSELIKMNRLGWPKANRFF